MVKVKKALAVMMSLLLAVTLFQAARPAVAENSAASGTVLTGEIAERLQDSLVLYAGSPVSLVGNAERQVDSGNIIVAPYVKDGRTMVPVRFVSENFKSDVNWDANTSTVTITAGAKTIKLVIGSSTMMIDGTAIDLDVPAELSNGRTFIPMRAVGEALGRKVFYDRGLVIIGSTENPFDPTREKGLLDQVISGVNKLPVVGTAENLQKLLPTGYNSQKIYAIDLPLRKSTEGAVSGVGYSTTNIQVEGVDEADLVKTDGTYIYQVNRQRVAVIKAYPADDMKVVSFVTFPDQNFAPQELNLDGNNLVVIGGTQFYHTMPSASLKIMPPEYYKNRTKAIVYSIADKEKIEKIREVELDGSYVSSRKIGTSLYLLANHTPNYWILDNGGVTVPTYRDTAVGEEDISIPLDQIRCIPPVPEPSYLLVAGFDLAQLSQETQVTTYLGAGENIYVSAQNMYVAVSNYQPIPVPEMKTLIYKFSLNQGKTTYLCKGEVPGTILNQFSMDEYDAHFRIATTVNQPWSSVKPSPWNNIYVLDENLNQSGKVEYIAPGEKIYSTRFMGERAYMVTFKSVDPLFVVDLKDHTNPRILGALKIPGYSDYLHPYDENHIIGFGKDTVEMPQKDYSGKVVGTMGYYLGIKMALFDVSDVNNPAEEYKVYIGDRGTDSELLRNHKALLFDKEKNLLSFPVTVAKVEGQSVDPRLGMPAYGKFAFQGAYVYSLDLTGGFTLKGTITHLSDQDLSKAGLYDFDRNKEVKRVIYIGDSLYTLSDGMIKANELVTLKEQASVQIGE